MNTLFEKYNLHVLLAGLARTSSLLCILHVAMKEDWNLDEVAPALHKSLASGISAHCIMCASKVDEAMLNMKISLRGSLRKSVNLVQVGQG